MVALPMQHPLVNSVFTSNFAHPYSQTKLVNICCLINICIDVETCYLILDLIIDILPCPL